MYISMYDAKQNTYVPNNNEYPNYRYMIDI